VFLYYSLEGDAAMPGRLYAGLCHAFLVYFILFSMCEQFNNNSNSLRRRRVWIIQLYSPSRDHARVCVRMVRWAMHASEQAGLHLHQLSVVCAGLIGVTDRQTDRRTSVATACCIYAPIIECDNKNNPL